MTTQEDTRVDVTRVIDIFGHPIQIKGDSARVADKLMWVNDRFFDAFEDGMYTSTIVLECKTSEPRVFLVHFSTSVCDEGRRAMYRGWVYGYLSDADLEWQDA